MNYKEINLEELNKAEPEEANYLIAEEHSLEYRRQKFKQLIETSNQYRWDNITKIVEEILLIFQGFMMIRVTRIAVE